MLYSMNRDKSLDLTAILAAYRTRIDHTFEAYLLNLLLFMRTATHARIDAKRKKAKLRPTEEDKNFTPKLAENDALDSLLQNQPLHRLFNKYSLEDNIDKDQIRKLYTEFAQTPEYKTYVETTHTPDSDAHKEILLLLYRNCLQNEVFIEQLDDHFSLWSEDKSLAVGAMKKTLKALPVPLDFYQKFKPDFETVDEFGKELLVKSIQNDSELLALLSPALKNWDADRIANIDLILIKMALTEFMEFPSIPTKVTLNEYVDLAKNYSTDKSKDFINGILDRLLKQLEEEGIIKKKGRGLL